MLLVREGIPAKLIGSEKPLIENFHVEMNLGKQKWLISCSSSSQHMEALSKFMDLHSAT